MTSYANNAYFYLAWPEDCPRPRLLQLDGDLVQAHFSEKRWSGLNHNLIATQRSSDHR